MSDEVLKHVEPIDGGSDSTGLGDHLGRASGDSTEALALADTLPPKERAELLAFTYRAGVVLSCVLAVISFCFEYHAQISHLPFEMREWMIGLILLPFGGAYWTYIKRLFAGRKLCQSCNSEATK